MKLNINMKNLMVTMLWLVVLALFIADSVFAFVCGAVAFLIFEYSFGRTIFSINKEEDKSVEELQKEHQEKCIQAIKFGTNEKYNKHKNKRYATKSRKVKGGK